MITLLFILAGFALVGWMVAITSWVDHTKTLAALDEALNIGEAADTALAYALNSSPDMDNVPYGLYIGANRYVTDNEEVLHLWDHNGNSYDLVWPRSADGLLAPVGNG